MPVNKNIFIHESDRSAMKALEAIPGFSQVTKAFLSNWNEKMMYLNNVASNIRVTEKQLPEYREMLLPICEKLGIEVPDLFLRMDVNPNAWTSGDTKPFIVITTGLLDTLPKHLIPTVLAHECGHIACHHVLYRTMGTMILNGLFTAFPLTAVAIYPIKAAFSYWMRCSEFSADRAAVLCDGSDENLMELCARFAGYPRNETAALDLDSFLDQAREYRSLLDKDGVNKAADFMMHSGASHPYHALRALEAREWTSSEEYVRSRKFFDAYLNHEEIEDFPIEKDAKVFVGKDKNEALDYFRSIGMEKITLDRKTEFSLFSRNETVTELLINGKEVKEGDWVTKSDAVTISYYKPYSDEEVRAMHPDEIRMDHSASYYVGKRKDEVYKELEALGFDYVSFGAVEDIDRPNDRSEDRVIRLDVEGRNGFEKGDWIPADTAFRIVYHARKW